MASAITKARQARITKFRRAYHGAVRRLTAYRKAHPRVNVLHDGYYIDGSFRDMIDDTGGMISPSFHMWELGVTSDERTAYVYECIDWGAYRTNGPYVNPNVIDTGTYAFALSDSTVPMFRGSGTYVGSIPSSQFAHIDWTTDVIIEATSMLQRAFERADMDTRIATGSKRFIHIVT
jgi:hypothetical protein